MRYGLRFFYIEGELSFSEVLPDGRTKIWIEDTEMEAGERYMICYLPGGEVEEIRGYSEKEKESFLEIIQKGQGVILSLSRSVTQDELVEKELSELNKDSKDYVHAVQLWINNLGAFPEYNYVNHYKNIDHINRWKSHGDFIKKLTKKNYAYICLLKFPGEKYGYIGYSDNRLKARLNAARSAYIDKRMDASYLGDSIGPIKDMEDDEEVYESFKQSNIKEMIVMLFETPEYYYAVPHVYFQDKFLYAFDKCLRDVFKVTVTQHLIMSIRGVVYSEKLFSDIMDIVYNDQSKMRMLYDISGDIESLCEKWAFYFQDILDARPFMIYSDWRKMKAIMEIKLKDQGNEDGNGM